LRDHESEFPIPTPTVVVTGGAGFIGSHVVDAVLGGGEHAVVVDDLSTGSADRVARDADLETVDITDREHLLEVVRAARPWAIIHLAAQSSVTRSVADPELDCRVNVAGTLNVVEAAREQRAAVVFTSTGGALYGNRAVIPTPEDAAPNPISPYGASKWAGEAYVRTWAEADRLSHSVCRLGNVYGPRQSPYGEAGVVAIFSHRLWSSEPPVVYGYGRPTRDYVHVADVARSLMLAAAGPGGVFNISTGTETSVMEILDTLQVAAGTAVEPILEPLRAGELEQSCMSPLRADRELGWRAEIPLREGLEDTYRQLVAGFEAARGDDEPPR
jgi:UDP-glucose 4-epimerase